MHQIADQGAAPRGPFFFADHMLILIYISPFLLLALTVLVPGVAASRAGSFWFGMWVSQGATALLVTLMAWWRHASRDLQLWLLGYDAMRLTQTEQLQNVAPENQAYAGYLLSQGMGVGWPVHAIIGWPLMACYAFVMFVVVWTLRLRSNRRTA